MELLRYLNYAGVWGWIGVFAGILSFALGNMYQFAPTGDGMYAVHLYTFCIATTLMMYCGLWVLKKSVMLSWAVLTAAVATLYITKVELPNVTEYSSQLQGSILAMKVAITAVVAATFSSFGARELFERLIWAGLLAFEGYSAVQYVVCKIAPEGGFGPDLYLHWGEYSAKSACTRAFGPIFAYIDVVVILAFMLWVIFRYVGKYRTPN